MLIMRGYSSTQGAFYPWLDMPTSVKLRVGTKIVMLQNDSVQHSSSGLKPNRVSSGHDP